MFIADIKESVKSTMPKPPIHCVSARHKRMPLLQLSTSRITVAPVVVKPDIASKNASLTFKGVEHNINGNIPKREIIIHASDAKSIPPLRFKTLFFGRERKYSDNPVAKLMAKVIAKALQSLSPQKSETISGAVIKADSTMSNTPSSLKIIRKFMVLLVLYLFIRYLILLLIQKVVLPHGFHR